MNKKIITITTILAITIAIGLYFLLQNPCSRITDQSMNADCNTQVAISKSNIKYCALDYYTQDCLEQADSQHNAKKDDVTALCQQVIDSSKREECNEYVNQYY